MTNMEEVKTETKKRTKDLSPGQSLLIDHVRVTVLELSSKAVRVVVDGAKVVDVEGARTPRLKKFRRVD